MVTGFEEQTVELSPEEKTLASIIAYGFSKRIGKDMSITNAQVVKRMNSKGYNVNDRRMRKIIQYIRVNYLVKNLVASSKGYYVENDEEEIQKYRKSLLERINAMQITLNSFKQ